MNTQIFGNLKLKYIDFHSPEVYKLFSMKKPISKKDVFNHQLEKLNIMLTVYNTDDFD
jgi:hypothetical protein